METGEYYKLGSHLHCQLVVKTFFHCPYFHSSPNQDISLSSLELWYWKKKKDFFFFFFGLRAWFIALLIASQSPEAQLGFSSQFQLSELQKGYYLLAPPIPINIFFSSVFISLIIEVPNSCLATLHPSIPPPGPVSPLSFHPQDEQFTQNHLFTCHNKSMRLWGRNYCYLHFTEEKIEARGLK